MDRQTGPRQQPSQVARPLELADGIEAPVEDAVTGLEFAQQPVQRVGSLPRPLGQALRPRLLQAGLQPLEARRMLSHEELGREVQGVESAGERAQLRLVQFQAQDLGYAELHPVGAHRAVLLQVREQEAVRQWWRRPGLGRPLLRRLGPLRNAAGYALYKLG